jgi:hypothetical protein
MAESKLDKETDAWLVPDSFITSAPSEMHERIILLLWTTIFVGYLLFWAPKFMIGVLVWFISVDWSLTRTIKPAYSVLDGDESESVDEPHLVDELDHKHKQKD